METVAAIRAARWGDRARLPIAALTANAVAGTREMFLASGFDDFLAKPIELAKLAALLERHVPRERRAAAAAPAPAPEGAPFESLAEALARVEGLNSVTGLA
ncbi:MAG: sensor histidine kinase, partial [Deltaproteobacteria bacterium]|nr:sensor histidine kinase [Deltaproteobacteria bacterium]